jgi:signal transduction histidine kinase/CheY-like chemotaxis protein
MTYRLLLFRLGRNLILAGVIAGGYFVFGLLGLLFRFYSDPIGILMPSAGLALSAVLLFGYRVVPGVILGSFCVNAWAFDFKHGYLIFYILSAFGSAIAASVGAGLIRKKIGFPNALVDLKSIIQFVLLGGPLSCMISATVVAVSMLYCGIISLVEIPAAWLSWWLADVIGVLIFTPILLTLFAYPHQIWSRRRITVGLPLTLSFTLVFLQFCYMNEIDRNKYDNQLKEKAEFMSQALVNRFRLDSYALYAIRSFLIGSNQVESEALTQLARQLLLPFKEIQAISWISLKETESTKNRLTVMLNDQGASNLEVIKNIPPEIRKKWMSASSVSEFEILITEEGRFKLFVPVVKNVNHRQEVSGVIVANFLIGSLIHEALDGLNTNHCFLSISTLSKVGTDTKNIFADNAELNLPAYETISIPVADQTWQLSFYHNGSKGHPIDDRSIEWIAFDGLCFVGFLGIVLLYLTGRYFRTEVLIEERTNTLKEMKASAESANNAKNQFLAKISHELRTPLNGISGFAQLLEKKASLHAEDKKHVAIIKQCSENLLKLINDILDISAIESQQLKTEIGEFDYVRLLNDSINIFKFRADEKGLKLVSKNRCTSRKFIGDEKRIRQILANLIDNAIKYTSQGHITISSSNEEGKLKISVADTGCGIGRENLERVFSPFVQINSGYLSREGVGLGLSITKELVHLMKGELDVISELGIGSTFSVSLPLPVSVDNQETTSSAMQHAESKYSEMHILVVDDNEINLLFLVCLLEQLGCKVDTASNGKEALEIVERNFYELALIDINMPIMDGLELVKHLRDRQLLLCVVAVSAYADQDRINEALKAGFDAYLTKPIEEKDLIELVTEINRNQSENRKKYSK